MNSHIFDNKDIRNLMHNSEHLALESDIVLLAAYDVILEAS